MVAAVTPGFRRHHVDETVAVRDSLLQAIATDVRVEHQAPTVATFKLFCHLANYNFTTITPSISGDHQAFVTEWLKQPDLYFAWDSIPTLSLLDLDRTKQKIYCGVATMADHLAVRKWYFSMSFKATTPVVVMKRLWMDKKNGFVEAFRSVKQGQCHMSSLLRTMGVADLRLPDLNTITVTDATRRAIVKYCASQRDHASSSREKLMALLFNAFFGVEAVRYERYRPKAGSQRTGVSRCGRWVVSQRYVRLVDDCERYVAVGGGGRDCAAGPTVAAELDA